ncbi:MAG: formate dehydrogenase accessory protein FdhE [Proteobacteria bacterium]|nr:formate dehydrogenase accessory protein FdhE [Pseudomonadota bacterium]
MTQMCRPAISTQEILRAAGILQKARPAYGALIDFYGQVFVAQAQSLSRIQLDPIVLDPGLLALKQDNAMPLIDPSQFLIDPEQADSLFRQICNLAMAHAPKLSTSGKRLSDALIGGDLNLASVFATLLSDQDLEPMAKKLDIPADELSLFAFSAMAPSIQSCSAQLSAYLKEGAEFKKGYCPVCGSHPDTAFLDQEGKRFLLCSLCAHEWLTLRMGCVFCDTPDQQGQEYFFSNEEKEYRVYVCDNCRHYLKLVDLRQLDRAFVPKLEQITTLHLDFKAQEKGYTGPFTKTKA